MDVPLRLSERLTTVLAEIKACEQRELLDRPLSAWSLPDDRRVPQMYLVRPVRDLLNLTFEELANTPSLGYTRIEKLIAVMDRICRGADPDTIPRSNSERRFLELKAELLGSADPAVLSRPLASWLEPTDTHLPQAYLGRAVSEILSTTYEHLAQEPGVGVRRIEKLLDVLERCGAELNPDRHPPRITAEPGESTATVQGISALEWRKWCDLIRLHRLERDCLGRYAGSLADLPQGLWNVRLGDYTDRSLHELLSLPGHGPARVGDILGVFARVIQSIRGIPADAALSIRLFSPRIRDAVLWAEGVLRDGTVPDLAAIRDGFLTPIFTLLEADLGVDTAAMMKRRMGLDGPAETLEQISLDAGVTRERVRQITAKAARAIDVRWPEGRYLLDDVDALFQSSPAAREQIDLLRGVFDTCFSLEVIRGCSRRDVLAAWDRAGRAKSTPMGLSAVHSWAGEEFPGLPPDAVRQWLEEEGLRRIGPEESLYFSNDPLDELLLHLGSRPDPMPVAELTNLLGGDERTAKIRLERDPRFVEDESKRVMPAERCAFERRNGEWYLRLTPVRGPDSRLEPIAVGDLINFVVGGLAQAGICDATVWGVHRFARTQLEKLFGSTLPTVVTPFVLARTFVLHSDGLVRHMRRRRLRWDTPHGSILLRGKRGWVDHVATTAGVPMTFDELAAALHSRFQDYEWYVLKQLNLLDDEEGEAEYGYQYLPGVSNAVPAMLIPAGWELDPASANISEGVRLAVAKLVSMSSRAPVPRSYLRRVPWMIRLCEEAAPATMRWSEAALTTEEDVPEEITSSESGATEDP